MDQETAEYPIDLDEWDEDHMRDMVRKVALCIRLRETCVVDLQPGRSQGIGFRLVMVPPSTRRLGPPGVEPLADGKWIVSEMDYGVIGWEGDPVAWQFFAESWGMPEMAAKVLATWLTMVSQAC